MNKKIIMAIFVVLLLIVGYGLFYVNDYYHAEKIAVDSLNSSSNVSAIKTSNGMLLDGPGNDTALIFYPGAKVEYTSYAPLFMNLSSQGIDCYLVEMPFNLAFLGQNSADEIIDDGNYSHYFLSGHSLGGAMAASYINSTNKTDGLILFASYSTCEIEKPVLSLYGSEDKVLNIEEYNKSKVFIDDNLTEFEITGANHAQFAYYGNQSGDGIAKISAESQQKQCVGQIINFISGVLNKEISH
ncbi:alpha/beta hydrolase [Methanobrevibacter sp.]|uniref:alpha/beta hydrolase n=1 Tax=Methanobrevibacter sp. TaxID=66852 RepID=UPI00388EA8D4